WSNLPSDPAGFNNSYLLGMAWYPEANGLVFLNGVSGIWFWNAASSSHSTINNAVKIGSYLNVAVYNPVLHNMLLGGGVEYTDPQRNFFILTYDSGTWSLSPARQPPNVQPCNAGYSLILDSGGQ